MNKIYFIIGIGGSGKKELIQKLTDNSDRLRKIISYTTKPKEENEEEGADYFFVSKEKFDNMPLIEKSKVGYYHYGVSREELIKNNNTTISLISVECSGLTQIKKYIEEEGLDIQIEIIHLSPTRKEVATNLRKKKMYEKDVTEKMNKFEVESTFKDLNLDAIMIKHFDKFTHITVMDFIMNPENIYKPYLVNGIGMSEEEVMELSEKLLGKTERTLNEVTTLFRESKTCHLIPNANFDPDRVHNKKGAQK